MPGLLAVAALLGLAVGSFLNVVIHRVPNGESVVRPASACPACHHTIRRRHNIPVIGWLLLCGSCYDCGARISARYPLIELCTAVLFVATVIHFIALHQIAALPAYLFFAAVLIALSIIDLEVMRLPNVIVLPSLGVLFALLGVAAIVEGSGSSFARALIGAGAMVALYLVLAVARPGGIGFGDVKFAGVIGAALGFLSYSTLIVGAFAAFALGGLVGVALMTFRGASRKLAIPFGPAMSTGALLAIFASAPLVHAYSHLLDRG